MRTAHAANSPAVEAADPRLVVHAGVVWKSWQAALACKGVPFQPTLLAARIA